MAAVAQSRPFYGVRFYTLKQATRNTGLRSRYRAADLAVEQFLMSLGKYHSELVYADRDRFGWLVPFRKDFRLIQFHRPCMGLREYLGVCPPDHPIFPIAVWLLGQCASRQASFDLDRLPVGDSVRARKHLARALRRVESWPRLRELVTQYPDDKFVHQMFASNRQGSLDRRITRFAQHVDHSHEAEAAVASQMPLWIRDAEWTLSPPKPASWMRMILERIRKWVRGE